MFLTALMPTYGRPRSVVANSIQLFLMQDYENKRLTAMEDGSDHPGRQGHPPLWCLTSCKSRFGSMPNKYDVMWGPHADAYVLWDDDDVYLPWHLSAHAAALENHGWSKPSRVWSTYTGELQQEKADGRFHGSIAIRRELLERVGGYRGVMPPGEMGRMDFDQRMIRALTAIEPPGDPCEHAEPSYVFRWADSGAVHSQTLLLSDDDQTWCRRMPKGEPLTSIKPLLDDSARAILSRLCKNRQHCL